MKVFRKTGVSTLINILGMSVAFAAAMILMVQVRWDTTYDANFKGHGQVFRMENNWMDKGLYGTYFSRPIIEVAKAASPNIEAVGTFGWMAQEVTLKKDGEETVLSVPSAPVDSSMFSVFPFEWVEGSAREFTAGETAVVSEKYAKIFFGDESAVGKTFKAGNGVEVRVIGVFKDMPKNYSMHYGVLVNLGDRYLDTPSEWSFAAYLKLKDPSRAKETEALMVNAVLEQYGDDHDADEADEFRNGFRIVKLHDAHFERDVRANIASANKAIGDYHYADRHCHPSDPHRHHQFHQLCFRGDSFPHQEHQHSQSAGRRTRLPDWTAAAARRTNRTHRVCDCLPHHARSGRVFLGIVCVRQPGAEG